MSPVKTLSDQSDSWGEGCRMDCLQNVQDGPNPLCTLTESVTFVLPVFVGSILVTDVSGVLGLLVFMGLYLALFEHLALILPGALFLGLVCVTGRAENCKVLPLLPHGNSLSLL